MHMCECVQGVAHTCVCEHTYVGHRSIASAIFSVPPTLFFINLSILIFFENLIHESYIHINLSLPLLPPAPPMPSHSLMTSFIIIYGLTRVCIPSLFNVAFVYLLLPFS